MDIQNQIKKLTCYSLVILIVGSSPKTIAQQRLSIGAIPDQSPERLNRLFNLLSKEIENELKVPVKYIPVTNYTAAVSAFRTGSIDLIWFGGLTGVQARNQRPGAKVIAQRDIDSKFRSVFIANKSSELKQIRTMEDLNLLKGKRFTFGSQNSTSGRLMPQYFLKQAGVKINEFAGRSPGFSGSHDTTIALVQSGSYEVGALNEQVWKINKKEKRIPISKIKVIWRTPTYHDYHWLAQPNLDERFGNGFTDKLKIFFIGMKANKSESQRKVLDLFGAKRFVRASEKDYSKIEQIGRELGKIK